MPKRLYIDSDILIYRAAFAAEIFDPLTKNYPCAREVFDQTTDSICRDVGISDHVHCVSSKTNFRKAIFPGYKSNRKAAKKPSGLSRLRNWVLAARSGWTVRNLEADDLLGIMATTSQDNVIASLDKDMGTLPNVAWYNFGKGEWAYQSLEQANEFFLIQALAGDSVDGYKGIPGIGPKKAAKILAEGGARWSTVVGAYVRHGLTAQDAFVNASMARILTRENYNLETGAMRPWEPRDLLTY